MGAQGCAEFIRPLAIVTELRETKEALASLQAQLTTALRQKERLSQLGEAVAIEIHNLRNILTTAQLFTYRLEVSQDTIVKRLVPKLVIRSPAWCHWLKALWCLARPEDCHHI